jgi:hypothetical protein
VVCTLSTLGDLVTLVRRKFGAHVVCLFSNFVLIGRGYSVVSSLETSVLDVSDKSRLRSVLCGRVTLRQIRCVRPRPGSSFSLLLVGLSLNELFVRLLKGGLLSL